MKREINNPTSKGWILFFKGDEPGFNAHRLRPKRRCIMTSLRINMVPIMIIFLEFFAGTNVFGLNLQDLVSREQANNLAAGERPVLTQFKNPQPQLVPENKFLAGIIEKIRADLDPSVMVETLHLYKKPPAAEKAAWSIEEETGLYNEILALSTLAGLQYFSASRGNMRTFYETSSVIDGPSTKKILPDPVFPGPEIQLTLYARQKDLTFGDNIYQYDFYSAPGAIIFTQQNLTSLTYGIIPAVGKNKLRSIVAIFDAGDYLLVYAASMAKAASLPGMKERIGSSFTNRAEAVLHWFSDQADKAYKKVYSGN